MVLTSHADLSGEEKGTGLWLSAFADAYQVFTENGFEVTVASPRGGQAPVDPLSLNDEYSTDGVKSFREDIIAQMELGNTWSLEEGAVIKYDAVYIAHGHGNLWDIASNSEVARILYGCLLDATPVAMVGHGVAALVALKKLRPQALQELQLTCFTDTEEVLLKRHHQIPFKLSEQLSNMGAIITHALTPSAPHVVEDGIFITGQNPASARQVAQILAGRLQTVQV